MVIEISRDIEQYKESVIFGLTAKQLIYSLLSVVIGGGLVLLLYQYIGLTSSAYVAIPVVAPIALGGFYSYNGMSFNEVMERKIQMLFFNRPLTYVSTESEVELKRYLREIDGAQNGIKKSRKKESVKSVNKRNEKLKRKLKEKLKEKLKDKPKDKPSEKLYEKLKRKPDKNPYEKAYGSTAKNGDFVSDLHSERK